MRIDILTLFPEMFKGPFDESIIKRARNESLVKITVHNLRRWAVDKRGSVDDRPYGGGTGMVIRPEPFFRAVWEIKKNLQGRTKIILLSAGGKLYNQQKAYEYSKFDNLILLCGHYEGVDQRVADFLADEEISVGNYILTGGELPACLIVDSVIRLIPGVLKKNEATLNESFTLSLSSVKGHRNNLLLLEYPQYTRPENFQGYKVPEILLSGNHYEIARWRQKEALKKTKKNRPDLIKPNNI